MKARSREMTAITRKNEGVGGSIGEFDEGTQSLPP